MQLGEIRVSLPDEPVADCGVDFHFVDSVRFRLLPCLRLSYENGLNDFRHENGRRRKGKGNKMQVSPVSQTAVGFVAGPCYCSQMSQWLLQRRLVI